MPANNSKDDYFNPIVKNMFEYINKSLDLLDEPKYSIIFFYTALELLFKARLLREHWTLTISDFRNSKSSFEQFKKGDFNSVYLDDAATRIRNLFKDLPDKYENNFKEIKDERNKLVHFPINNVEKEKEKLLQVLYRAWHYMIFLLTKQWNEIFIEFNEDIQNIDKRMKQNNDFLKEKSSLLKTEIPDKYKDAKICYFCGYDATICKKSYYNNEIKSYKCDVCENYFFDISKTFIDNELKVRLVNEVKDELESENLTILNEEIIINNLIISNNLPTSEDIFDNINPILNKIDGFVDLSLLVSLEDTGTGYESKHDEFSFSVDFEIDLDKEEENFIIKRVH